MPSRLVLLAMLVSCSTQESVLDSGGSPAGADAPLPVTSTTTDAPSSSDDSSAAWWVTASDDFEGDLSLWSAHQPEDATSEIIDGALVLQPRPNTLWFNEHSAFGLFQTVSGDLSITAPVWVHRASDADLAPEVPFRLGGIMLRDPTEDDTEDYVFLVLGTDGQDLSVETKSTDNDISVFMGPTWPSTSAELRICRVGPTVRFLARGAGAWQELGDFDRPDLPDTLLAGLITYANVPEPDVIVGFDEVRFSPLSDLDDCGRP